jgi:hypothetical protein
MLPADVMHEKRDQNINDNESPKEYTNKWSARRRGMSRHLPIIPPTAPNANAQPNFPILLEKRKGVSPPACGNLENEVNERYGLFSSIHVVKPIRTGYAFGSLRGKITVLLGCGGLTLARRFLLLDQHDGFQKGPRSGRSTQEVGGLAVGCAQGL